MTDFETYLLIAHTYVVYTSLCLQIYYIYIYIYNPITYLYRTTQQITLFSYSLQHAWVSLWPLKVQRTASSALRWLHKHCGSTTKKDMVARISAVGAGGRHQNNAERDLHRLLQRVSMSLAAKPETVQVRMVNPSTVEIDWEPLPVLFPDALIQAFWEAGEDVFRYCLFGLKSEDEIFQIWKHMEKHCRWVSAHPASGWKWRGKVASIGMYGDEIQCYRNSECGVVSVTAWTSEFCTDSIPLLRYYPIAVWSEHCECEFTYGDLEQHLVQRWRRLSDTSETWPWTDAGYLIAYTFCQGDLKWINSRMGGLHNYRRNDFCSRCECVKNHADAALTLPNMGDDPDTHAVRTYSSEQLEAFSPLLGLPGMCLSRVMHDVAHSQFLGTGKTTNGSLALVCINLFVLSLNPGPNMQREFSLQGPDLRFRSRFDSHG